MTSEMSRVNIRDTLSSFISGLDINWRPIMLDFGLDQKALQSALALQHGNIREGMMSGLTGPPRLHLAVGR